VCKEQKHPKERNKKGGADKRDEIDAEDLGTVRETVRGALARDVGELSYSTEVASVLGVHESTINYWLLRLGLRKETQIVSVAIREQEETRP